MIRVAVVPGDGAGREVVPEAVKALRALGLGSQLEFEEFEVGAERVLRGEPGLPEDVFQQLRAADAILFGAVGDPRVPDVGYAEGILLRLRFELDLYVNLRPARLYDDRLSPLRDESRRALHMVTVRENTEGVYVGVGGRFKRGTDDELAVQEDVNTAKGVSRILEYGFRRATREVCLVDKSNAMRFAGGLWQDRYKALRAIHPEVGSRHLYVDAAAMELVRDPTQFDVIVTGNLFGDILSDLTAQLMGGIGLAPSANLNPEAGRGLYEPVHGSAPNLAGKGVVNPVGAILAAGLMLEQHGLAEAATRVEEAVAAALRAGECTRDVGGDMSTAEAGDAISRRL